jgi:hypothetical protein
MIFAIEEVLQSESDGTVREARERLPTDVLMGISDEPRETIGRLPEKATIAD